jgi:CMP/dCMP kinase
MKKHIITLAGAPGSGKSSTAKGVASVLGYEHLSSGDLFRKMAAERGLSIEEINFTAEKQKEIDLKVDEWLVELGKSKNNLIIDSRTAFHWIPDSFKVFLDLDANIAAGRTFAQMQKEGRTSQTATSVEEVLDKTLQRVTSENKRYHDLYDLNVTDKKNFDLVVDTNTNDLEQVIVIVTAAYKEWLAS